MDSIMHSFSHIFRLINIIAGLSLGTEGVFTCINPVGFRARSTIIGLGAIFFGATVVFLEFRKRHPIQVARYARFLYTFSGRGLAYAFMGASMNNYLWTWWAPSAIVAYVGAFYLVLAWLPAVQKPGSMCNPALEDGERLEIEEAWG
jgi:hypothetical protein